MMLKLGYIIIQLVLRDNISYVRMCLLCARRK